MEEEDGNGAFSGAKEGNERLPARVGVDIAVKSISFWKDVRHICR